MRALHFAQLKQSMKLLWQSMRHTDLVLASSIRHKRLRSNDVSQPRQ